MRHCGNEKCLGAECKDWGKCRGETIPPWNCAPSKSTAAVCIREQDVLEAADTLASEVLSAMADECMFCIEKNPGKDCEKCAWNLIGKLAEKYQKERKGYVR